MLIQKIFNYQIKKKDEFEVIKILDQKYFNYFIK